MEEAEFLCPDCRHELAGGGETESVEELGSCCIRDCRYAAESTLFCHYHNDVLKQQVDEKVGLSFAASSGANHSHGGSQVPSPSNQRNFGGRRSDVGGYGRKRRKENVQNVENVEALELHLPLPKKFSKMDVDYHLDDIKAMKHNSSSNSFEALNLPDVEALQDLDDDALSSRFPFMPAAQHERKVENISCKVPGCAFDAVIKGLCEAHFPSERVGLAKKCIVKECSNSKRQGSDFCSNHRDSKVCTAVKCSSSQFKESLCKFHLQQKEIINEEAGDDETKAGGMNAMTDMETRKVLSDCIDAIEKFELLSRANPGFLG